MVATVEDSPTAEVSWRNSAERALRRLSAITLAGALLGLLVGGVGGRLAMMLLARLNPDATGVTSDDGFRSDSSPSATPSSCSSPGRSSVWSAPASTHSSGT